MSRLQFHSTFVRTKKILNKITPGKLTPETCSYLSFSPCLESWLCTHTKGKKLSTYPWAHRFTFSFQAFVKNWNKSGFNECLQHGRTGVSSEVCVREDWPTERKKHFGFSSADGSVIACALTVWETSFHRSVFFSCMRVGKFLPRVAMGDLRLGWPKDKKLLLELFYLWNHKRKIF